MESLAIALTSIIYATPRKFSQKTWSFLPKEHDKNLIERLAFAVHSRIYSQKLWQPVRDKAVSKRSFRARDIQTVLLGDSIIAFCGVLFRVAMLASVTFQWGLPHISL